MAAFRRLGTESSPDALLEEAGFEPSVLRRTLSLTHLPPGRRSCIRRKAAEPGTKNPVPAAAVAALSRRRGSKSARADGLTKRSSSGRTYREHERSFRSRAARPKMGQVSAAWGKSQPLERRIGPGDAAAARQLLRAESAHHGQPRRRPQIRQFREGAHDVPHRRLRQERTDHDIHRRAAGLPHPGDVQDSPLEGDGFRTFGPRAREASLSRADVCVRGKIRTQALPPFCPRHRVHARGALDIFPLRAPDVDQIAE